MQTILLPRLNRHSIGLNWWQALQLWPWRGKKETLRHSLERYRALFWLTEQSTQSEDIIVCHFSLLLQLAVSLLLLCWFIVWRANNHWQTVLTALESVRSVFGHRISSLHTGLLEEQKNSLDLSLNLLNNTLMWHIFFCDKFQMEFSGFVFFCKLDKRSVLVWFQMLLWCSFRSACSHCETPKIRKLI